MDVSRRDFIRLGTSAAVTATAVAQAGGGRVAATLPAIPADRSVQRIVVPSLCYS